MKYIIEEKNYLTDYNNIFKKKTGEIIAFLIEKYYKLFYKQNILIGKITLFPFNYKYINLSNLELPHKEKMYKDFNGTKKEFENYYSNYLKIFNKKI